MPAWSKVQLGYYRVFNLILWVLYTPTVSLDVISLEQAVADIIGGRSSNTLRNNSRGTWRHREGARATSTTPPSAARVQPASGESVTADVHGCPEAWHRSGTLSRSRTPWWRTRERNDPIASPFHGIRCPPVHPIFVSSWQWLPHGMLVGSH